MKPHPECGNVDQWLLHHNISFDIMPSNLPNPWDDAPVLKHESWQEHQHPRGYPGTGRWAWTYSFTQQTDRGNTTTISGPFWCGAAWHTAGRRPKPLAPCAGDVLASLMLDASYADYTLDEFASDVGADKPSVALRMHQFCMQTEQDLSNTFTPAQRVRLAELLEDW